jgi:hypothetical protein
LCIFSGAAAAVGGSIWSQQVTIAPASRAIFAQVSGSPLSDNSTAILGSVAFAYPYTLSIHRVLFAANGHSIRSLRQTFRDISKLNDCHVTRVDRRAVPKLLGEALKVTLLLTESVRLSLKTMYTNVAEAPTMISTNIPTRIAIIEPS